MEEVKELGELAQKEREESTSIKQMLLEFKEAHKLQMKKEMQKFDQMMAQKRVLETKEVQYKKRITDHERENANQRQDLSDLNKEYKDL